LKFLTSSSVYEMIDAQQQTSLNYLISRSRATNSNYFVLAHLFVKILRSEDSEVTFSVFESSCHLLYYLSNQHLKV